MIEHRVLFVCLGNICRSPMAEAIFRHKVNVAGLTDSFSVESAGTGNWHVGELPDARTLKVLNANGITQVSRARQVAATDFEEFDHVVAMDMANLRDLENWIGSIHGKLSLMSNWNPNSTHIEVPDPYYGTYQDFELVFAMLDSACESMLLKQQNS